MRSIKTFFTEDSGIAVEWVVLTAAIVGVCIAFLMVYAPSLGELAKCNANTLEKDYNCATD